MITVLVTGGRRYTNRLRLYEALDRIDFAHGIKRIVNGGATGADALARQWANDRHIDCATYPADWRQHSRAAGPLRNDMMLRMELPEVVVAFLGGRGTADMVRRARTNDIRVIEIAP